MTKKSLKFNISPAWGVKIMKSPQEIPFIKNFPIISKACPNFLKIFNFDFVEFSFTR